MEDWIGILLIVLMIPGLILLIGVVVLALFHLKGDSKQPITTIEPSTPPVKTDA